MKTFLYLALAASLTASLAAQTARKPPAKPKPASVTAEDLKALRDALAAQQQQIQDLKQALERKDQAWQQAQQQAQQQVQQAQAAASEAQQKASSVQAAADEQQSTVAKLSSDMADVKTTVTNSVVGSQDEQKRMSALEGVLGRFRFTGDVRVRGEDFFQKGVVDRNRARIRARFGLEGQLGEDYVGGLFLSSGSLGDSTSPNETLTNFFDRKTVAVDRAYITYNPGAHKWLSLTGGKFATPWTRTSLTFDGDINPEGFDAKASFDVKYGPLRNFTAQSMLLTVSESSGAADTYAVGGQVSGALVFGPWTLRPSYMLLNWRNADAILNASAFAVGATTAGTVSTSGTGPVQGINVPGEGPGCAKVVNGPTFPPCAYGANGMTNSTFVTVASNGVPTAHFLSKFLYSDLVLNNQIKTGIPKLPLNVMLEFEENLNAANNPFDNVGAATTLGKQNKAYGFDVSLGQAAKKGDVTVGYSWWRIEQDAIIASFSESDQRAPTNAVQNRIYGMWRMQKNVMAQYTLWLGRTLNNGLENNVATVKTAPGDAPTKEPTLKRQQFDLIYTF